MLKSQKKHILATLGALVLAFTMTTTAFAATTLDVTRVKQAKSYWCWAAVGEMIGTYMNGNSSRTQWDIVAHIKGSSYPNDPGSDSELAKGIKYASMDTVTYTSGSTLSWDKHTSNIGDGNPVGVKMIWDDGGAHALVCAGTKTSSGNNYLYIIDPAGDNTSEWYNYTSLKNGTSIQSGKGTYSTSFYKK